MTHLLLVSLMKTFQGVEFRWGETVVHSGKRNKMVHSLQWGLGKRVLGLGETEDGPDSGPDMEVCGRIGVKVELRLKLGDSGRTGGSGKSWKMLPALVFGKHLNFY